MRRFFRWKCLGSGDPPGLQNRWSLLTGDGVFDSHALPPASGGYKGTSTQRSLRHSCVEGNRRVPHVRTSVRGPKMIGEAHRSLSLIKRTDLRARRAEFDETSNGI